MNERYHDVAAASYDSKWGIDFGEIGQEQVTRQAAQGARALARRPFGDALEIGAGTGYFSLNLLQAGAIERATATDISPGMLATLEANSERLGLEVRAAAAEAETLPFADESFDLVFGHAVLHHIPDLSPGVLGVRPGAAAGRDPRLLRGAIALRRPPGGDPEEDGAADRAALAAARRRLRAGPRGRGRRERPSTSSPRSMSTPSPPATCAASAEAAGLLGKSGSSGEELLASIHGWTVRTLEASAEPEEVPWGWRRFAFRSYMALQRVDNQVLEPRLPPQLFYNLLISARKPQP